MKKVVSINIDTQHQNINTFLADSHSAIFSSYQQAQPAFKKLSNETTTS